MADSVCPSLPRGKPLGGDFRVWHHLRCRAVFCLGLCCFAAGIRVSCISLATAAVLCKGSEHVLGVLVTKWDPSNPTADGYKCSVLLYAALYSFLAFLCNYLAESDKVYFVAVLKTLQHLWLCLPISTWPINWPTQRNKDKDIMDFFFSELEHMLVSYKETLPLGKRHQLLSWNVSWGKFFIYRLHLSNLVPVLLKWSWRWLTF